MGPKAADPPVDLTPSDLKPTPSPAPPKNAVEWPLLREACKAVLLGFPRPQDEARFSNWVLVSSTRPLVFWSLFYIFIVCFALTRSIIKHSVLSLAWTCTSTALLAVYGPGLCLAWSKQTAALPAWVMIAHVTRIMVLLTWTWHAASLPTWHAQAQRAGISIALHVLYRVFEPVSGWWACMCHGAWACMGMCPFGVWSGMHGDMAVNTVRIKSMSMITHGPCMHASVIARWYAIMR